MSDSEIRIQADKWECELMEEQLKQLQAERDEAVAESEGKDKTINTLTRMYWELKRSCAAALETVKRRKIKKNGKLLAALAIVVAVAALAALGVGTDTLCASVGKPVEAICLAVGSFLTGWIFERIKENYKLLCKVEKQKEAMDRKGD